MSSFNSCQVNSPHPPTSPVSLVASSHVSLGNPSSSLTHDGKPLNGCVPFVSPDFPASPENAQATPLLPTYRDTQDRFTAVSDHSKRGRDDSDGSADIYLEPPTSEPSPHKRSRENRYIAPRKVPQTFTSTVGSLAVTPTWGQGSGERKVPLRRQLSGSNMESFLGGDHDAMDVDTETSRPRSMSL